MLNRKIDRKIRIKYLDPLKSYAENRALKRLKNDPTMWQSVEEILLHSESTGCTFYELEVLYRHITEHKPALVLELGSGVSTIVMGYAAKKVRDLGMPCTIVSMEESAYYYDDVCKLIPKDIIDCVELIQSPVEDIRLSNDFIARRYVNVPPNPYDLVFIDGPQVPKFQDDPRYFDGDILRVIEWNQQPFTAYLDGRRGTRINLQRLMNWANFDFNKRHKFTRIDIPAVVERGAIGL